MPADNRQGLSPAPCLSAAQEDRSQLLPARRGGDSQQWRSELSMGVGSRRTLLRESKKCSSGKTPAWGGSCCYFPDNCTHCAASVASKVSPCLCTDSSSWERGLLMRGEEVVGEKEGSAATTSLHMISFHAGIKVHMVTHAHSSWGLTGSCSSIKWVGCSVARPFLPYTHSHSPSSATGRTLGSTLGYLIWPEAGLACSGVVAGRTVSMAKELCTGGFVLLVSPWDRP